MSKIIESPENELKCVCGKELRKQMERRNGGGFDYVFICPDHGTVKRRQPSWQEISEE